MTAMRHHCLIPDCPQPADTAHMCHRHYQQHRRGTPHQRQPRLIGPGDWAEQGACRGRDPEWWFPMSERPGDPNCALALSICTGCPVLDVCRDWATQHQPCGIAGGLTTAQRETRRRNRRNTPAGVR